MFAMVHGPWPRVTNDGVDLDALEADVAAGKASSKVLDEARERLVRDVVMAQADAGLDLVTDGQVRWADPEHLALEAVVSMANGVRNPGFLAEEWRRASAHTDRRVAQIVPGPYTLGRRVVEGDAEERQVVTTGIADTLADELAALLAAGCQMVVIDEPAATVIGADAAERELFVDSQQRLLAQAPGLHAMLAITGGSALAAGAETIFAAPYASHLFDLIAGPDDWGLVRAAPADRGIVCAALRAGPGTSPDQSPELVWAAHYAASSMRRGLARVGIANATPLRHLSRRAAKNAAKALARAARLAVLPRAEALAAGLDPKTFGTEPPRRTPDPAPRAQRRRATRES
jgi:hypothetical protein